MIYYKICRKLTLYCSKYFTHICIVSIVIRVNSLVDISLSLKTPHVMYMVVSYVKNKNYCQEHRELTKPGKSTDNLVHAGSRTKTSNCSVNKQQTHMSMDGASLKMLLVDPFKDHKGATTMRSVMKLY